MSAARKLARSAKRAPLRAMPEPMNAIGALLASLSGSATNLAYSATLSNGNGTRAVAMARVLRDLAAASGHRGEDPRVVGERGGFDRRSATWNVLASADYAAACPTLRAGDALRGATVVVCGAGPSLAAELPRLAELGDRVVVFAVNSSARPVCAVRQPDAIIAMESLDISDSLRGTSTDLYVLGERSARATWEVALAQGPIVVSQFTTGAVLGAVHTAAASGAACIVLVGVDLTASPYVAGSPNTLAYRREVWQRTARMLGFSDDDARQAHEDLEARLADRRFVPARDGGRVETCATRWAQAVQLERFASAHPDLRLINASQGGVQIGGWENGSLAEAPHVGAPRNALASLFEPAPDFRAFVSHVRAEIGAARLALRAALAVRAGGLEALSQLPEQAAMAFLDTFERVDTMTHDEPFWTDPDAYYRARGEAIDLLERAVNEAEARLVSAQRSVAS